MSSGGDSGTTSPPPGAHDPAHGGPRRRRDAALAAAALAVALGVVAARLLADSSAALDAAARAAAGGDPEGEVRELFAAARAYLPGSPFVPRALDRLDAVADAALRDGRTEIARRALEAERAAILGARWLVTPHADRLAHADARLAALYARIEDPAVDPGASQEQRTAWHAERLARRPGPHTGFAVLALGGFLLWLGAAVGFFTRGLDAGLRLRRGPAIAAGLAFAVGMSLFLVGLRLA